MSDANRVPRIDILRSPLGRARGLGAAHQGAGAWLGHGISSIALVPLSLWFICGMVRMIGATRDDVAAWLGSPLVLTLMLCLLVMTFYHMRHGLEAVVQDYVQQPALLLASLLAIRAVSFFLALACIVSVLRLGL
jgi:succinate dehydrogenase / fumarate reductase, membrane anchor subunit